MMLTILDDLFSFAEREQMYSFIQNSNYTTNGTDTQRLEHKGDINIYSNFSEQDVDNYGILKNAKVADALQRYGRLKIKQARVNLSTLNDKNHFHTDSTEGVTLLYYPNMVWGLEWGGYTLFANNDLTEITKCVAYKPGRVILFNSEIPHCIAAPTNLAPTYRFSFAIHFIKDTK